MSSDGAAAAAASTDVGYCRVSSKHEGSKTPPTPPGSPIDRPFPAATLPPPAGKTVLQMIREEGDGCRRSKSDSKSAKKSASHRSSATSAGRHRDCLEEFLTVKMTQRYIRRAPYFNRDCHTHRGLVVVYY